MHTLATLNSRAQAMDICPAAFPGNAADPEDWLALIFAFQDAGRWEDALRWLYLARERFPEHIMLCYWGGAICQSVKRWEEALVFWEKALQLDPDFTDAAYGCAECREKLGDWNTACKIWDSLACRLETRGLAAESVYPRKQAGHCRSHLDCAFV